MQPYELIDAIDIAAKQLIEALEEKEFSTDMQGQLLKVIDLQIQSANNDVTKLFDVLKSCSRLLVIAQSD